MGPDRFGTDGFLLVPQLLRAQALRDIASRLDADAPGAVGTRNMLRQGWCRSLAESIAAHAVLRDAARQRLVPVQCTCFEKSAGRNWLVPVHQDTAIPVAARVESASLRGWSEKEGTLYVQAPDTVLEQLVAVRLHVDDCGESDGPLQVVPGSHRLGRVTEDQASQQRRHVGAVACIAAAGDALFMRPLLLHLSSKATGTSRRRVLHFLFGPASLPHGLEWAAA